jgi:AGCS family alanine or glycine:cation symporter
MSLELVWKMSDVLNGMMAIPNLIALVFLAPVVFRLSREYFAEEQQAEIEKAS